MEIKKVDFSGIRTGKDASSAVLDQLHEAFSTIGFVTIVNHGLEVKVNNYIVTVGNTCRLVARSFN